MERIIIGLVGPIASGKGVLSDYLSTNGYILEKLSDRIREEVTFRGLEITRKNLQDVGNELREKHGNQVLAELTIKKHLKSKQSVCIDGVRNPGELSFIKSAGGFIIGITAKEERRLKWYLERAENRGEDGASKEAFYAANNRDLGEGEGEAGQQVGICLQMCDYLIENTGTKEDLISKIKDIIRTH